MEEQPQPHHQPVPEHPHTDKPAFDDSLVHHSPGPKSGKWLAIALVVSAVFLLVAAGIAYWLITKSGGTTTSAQQPTGDGSDTVKSLSFVAASTLPAAYVARPQNTQTTQTTYYFDPATDCGITTTVVPFTTGKSAKDQVVDAAKAASAYGVGTESNTDATAVKIADADGKHTYNFPAVHFEQNVSVAGVAFTHQKNVVAYKQFGTSLASIGYSCKDETWAATSPQLVNIAQTFTVKTER